jgi:MoxR-like ATPase
MNQLHPIDVSNYASFVEATKLLSSINLTHRRVLGVYFACRYRNIGLPRIRDVHQRPVGAKDLERAIIDFYIKEHPALGQDSGRYWKPFRGLGFADPFADNQFRDTMKWSSGTGCVASKGELLSPEFLVTSRAECPHKVVNAEGDWSCNLAKRPYMQGRDRSQWPRLVRHDVTGGGENYTVLDLESPEIVAQLAPDIRSTPLESLIVALYFGARWADQAAVTIETFARDFRFRDSDEVFELFGNRTVSTTAVKQPVQTQRNAPLLEDQPALVEAFQLLLRYKNLIIEGVPGTGKTYAFEQLRDGWESLSGLNGRPRFLGSSDAITFHPAIGYEDFVEGLRKDTRKLGDSAWFFEAPGEDSGWATVDGFFLRACRRAFAEPFSDHLILIDELNRANVPRVIGDLLTTIESGRRLRFDGGIWQMDQEIAVTLPLSGRRLVVPENLYVVATINTTDRSVTPLDAAMRRRFAFIRVEPLDMEEAKRVLLTELQVNTQSELGQAAVQTIENSVRVHSQMNSMIRGILGPDCMIGHSYLFGLVRALNSAATLPEESRPTPLQMARQTWLQEIIPQLIDTASSAGREEEVFAREGENKPGTTLFERERWLLGDGKIRIAGQGLLARVMIMAGSGSSKFGTAEQGLVESADVVYAASTGHDDTTDPAVGANGSSNDE